MCLLEKNLVTLETSFIKFPVLQKICMHILSVCSYVYMCVWCLPNSLLLQCLSHDHVHIFIPSCISLFCVYFSPSQFLTFAFASRHRHSLRCRRARRISITLSGRADTHLPADESREPAGEAGWKVRVQQLWIIDTGQNREFSGQSCQLMCGCTGMWWRPSGAWCTVQVHNRCTVWCFCL